MPRPGARLPVAEGSPASATAAGVGTEGFLFQAVGVAVWHNLCSPAFNFGVSACFISSCCREEGRETGNVQGNCCYITCLAKGAVFVSEEKGGREENFLPTPSLLSC